MKLLKNLPILILSVSLMASCEIGGNKQHNHSYDFQNGKWFWSQTETGYSASFTANCGSCEEGTDGHHLELDATVTKTETNPTCTAQGSITYTATVQYDGKSYTDKKEFSTDALGHVYSSIKVEGDYKKNYEVFDVFDDSNIVVKTVCERCGDEQVISRDEYFIVYNTFGVDYLSAGDTSVTISYQGKKKVLDGLTVTGIAVEVPAQDSSVFTYDGEEKVYSVAESEYYEVTGNKETNAGEYEVVISLKDKTNYVWSNGNSDDLVYNFKINKAANEITGLESSYETTCGTQPDFSGVTSNANDIELSYYNDSEMTQEVLESNLSAGTYYLKATSGGANYEEVIKTATLTVSHSFDQEVIDEKYLKTPATEDTNAVYYKSCVCGEVSTETFVAEGTKLPSLIADSSYNPSELTDEEAPEGFSTVRKSEFTFSDEYQGKEFLSEIDITNYSSILFAFKTENRRFCDSNWGNPIPVGEWHFVTFTLKQDGTYLAVIKNANGEVKISNESATSFRSAFEYYNWDGSEPNMVWYSTEVLGVKLDANGEYVSGSSVDAYETLTGPVPLGYARVTQGTVTYSDANQGHSFLANLDISNYSSVFFAFKTANRRFCNSSWGSPLSTNVWYYVTVTENNGKYDCVIKDAEGNAKISYEGKASFRESLPYYNWDGSAPNMVWTSTEVRGILK